MRFHRLSHNNTFSVTDTWHYTYGPNDFPPWGAFQSPWTCPWSQDPLRILPWSRFHKNTSPHVTATREMTQAQNSCGRSFTSNIFYSGHPVRGFFPPLYLSSNFKGSADHRSPQWKEICADTNPGRSIEALVANHEITVIFFPGSSHLPVMQLAPHCIHYSILLRFAAKWSYNFRGRGNLWSKIKYTLEVKLNKLLAWTSDDQFVRSSPKFVYSRIFNSRFTVYMSSYDLHFAPPFSSYFRWQSWFLYCL